MNAATGEINVNLEATTPERRALRSFAITALELAKPEVLTGPEVWSRIMGRLAEHVANAGIGGRAIEVCTDWLPRGYMVSNEFCLLEYLLEDADCIDRTSSVTVSSTTRNTL